MEINEAVSVKRAENLPEFDKKDMQEKNYPDLFGFDWKAHQKKVFDDLIRYGESMIYAPEQVVNISTISTEEWLDYRRQGICASDAGIIMLGGTNYTTERELALDKLKMRHRASESASNQYRLDFGHCLEAALGEFVRRYLGADVYEVRWMYRDHKYKHLMCDLDGMCDLHLPDGSTVRLGLEFKSFDPELLYHWKSGVYGADAAVAHANYPWQVMQCNRICNLTGTLMVAACDSNADHIRMILFPRNVDMEMELIHKTEKWWNDHVVHKNIPVDSVLNDRQYRRFTEDYPVTSSEELVLSEELRVDLENFRRTSELKSAYAKKEKEADELLKACQAKIIKELNGHDIATLRDANGSAGWLVTMDSTEGRLSVDTAKLSLLYPEVLAQVAEKGKATVRFKAVYSDSLDAQMKKTLKSRERKKKE